MHADIKHTYMQDAAASILRSLSPLDAPLRTDAGSLGREASTAAVAAQRNSGPSDSTRFDSVLLLTILLRSGNVDPACAGRDLRRNASLREGLRRVASRDFAGQQLL